MRTFALASTAGLAAILWATAAWSAQSRYIVIQNLNPPHDCQVLRADGMFIQIYSRVHGPVPRAQALRFARNRCKAPRR